MNMLPNDVRVVRNDNTKILLLTDTYILQGNRARFNQHAVGDTCNLLCLANNESREHFLVECSRLGKVRHQYRPHLNEILLHDNSETLVQSYISNNDSC